MLNKDISLELKSWSLFFLSITCLTFTSISQPRASAKTSDAVIVYDKKTYQPTGSSVIPFDKRFTLQIPHFVRPGAKYRVYLYAASFEGGYRHIVSKDGFTGAGVKLDSGVQGDTLNIYFHAIKPSKSFEIAVGTNLNGHLLDMAHRINEYLYDNNITDATVSFNKLQDSCLDQVMNVTFFQYRNSLSRYQLYYTNSLSTFYDNLHNPASYRTAQFPDQVEVSILERSFRAKSIGFNDNFRLMRILAQNNDHLIIDGTLNIDYTNLSEAIPRGDFKKRIKNLEKSSIFFDTLINATSKSLAVQDDNTIRIIRNKLFVISYAIRSNRDTMKSYMEQIDQSLASNTDLSAAEVLIGSTISKDIRTIGGNIITMDLGLTNIFSWDLNNRLVYFPRPYYGINIYLRPIDKNTRMKDFLKRGSRTPNPHFRLLSMNDLLQHLSIGIGLTFTGMTNTQFDNLLNNNMLTAGLGYRIGRIAKVGTGLAMLKRTSKNPLISDKRVVGGYYISVSADLDVAQGIKDFISIIFK